MYAGKNITSSIEQYLITLTFTDKTEGESDEIDIQLEDSRQLWQGSWYPTKGDKMELFISRENGSEVRAGGFEVDEIEFSGPPDTVSIRGQATGITKKLRTKRSDAFENVTVKQLAEKIASRNGLTVDGAMGKYAGLTHARISQNREDDLAFLKRVATSYGIFFSIKDSKLVFTDQQKIEARKVARVVDRKDMESWSFRDKSVKTYAGAQVAWKNPDTDEVVQATYKPEGDGFASESAGGDIFSEFTGQFANSADVFQSKERSENKQQAEAKAEAALYRANTKQKEGSFKVKGDPLLCAGNNVQVTGMGKMSGKWSIDTSTHSFSKGGGYSTDCTLKQVGK